MAICCLPAGRPAEALAEYLAYRSLQPHDGADAHYRIARAYQAAGDLEAARRHVLSALEIATHFQAAQALLLELSGG